MEWLLPSLHISLNLSDDICDYYAPRSSCAWVSGPHVHTLRFYFDETGLHNYFTVLFLCVTMSTNKDKHHQFLFPWPFDLSFSTKKLMCGYYPLFILWCLLHVTTTGLLTEFWMSDLNLDEHFF